MILFEIGIKYSVIVKGIMLTDCWEIIFLKQVFILIKCGIYITKNNFRSQSFSTTAVKGGLTVNPVPAKIFLSLLHNTFDNGHYQNKRKQADGRILI